MPRSIRKERENEQRYGYEWYIRSGNVVQPADQSVANKQRYESDLYVPWSDGVQAGSSSGVEELRDGTLEFRIVAPSR